jgi:hypothetical protein
MSLLNYLAQLLQKINQWGHKNITRFIKHINNLDNDFRIEFK